MKILFVENRYKTYLWEEIGKEFLKLGYEVHFIVQNLSFLPKSNDFIVHKLLYPKKALQELSREDRKTYKKVIQSNRGINYFGINNNGFIKYYDKLIIKILSKVQPNIVFGESTLFHELLVINFCKNQGVLYLHPSSCRYPKNRFAFYRYDTLKPYKGSGETLDFYQAEQMANSIGERESLPDYIKPNIQPPSKIKLIKNKLLLTKTYLLGEKYNTPSHIKKLSLNIKRKKNIRKYEKLSIKSIPIVKGIKVMYTLHMQPEANIDVWGYPNSNQALVVETIVKALGNKDVLIIKPNPKSKYEIDTNLINIINKYPKKIKALSHTINMSQIWDYVNLVVTVTGTVSIECIFNNKPVAMFGSGIQSEQKNCIQISSSNNLKQVIKLVRNERFPKLTRKEKIKFINELNATSYRGIISDPFSDNDLFSKSNMDLVLGAFKKVINND